MLRIEQCSVVYPNGVCALDGVSLRFELGRFIVLLGPSGAGKSSLLRCLNGLIRPSRGAITGSDNQSIFVSAGALRRHRRQTAMIFQQHHLIGRHTALKNVLLGRLGFHTSLRSRDELIAQLHDADAMLAFMTDTVDGELLSRSPRLRIVACALKGHDNFDVEACTRAGVSADVFELEDRVRSDRPRLVSLRLLALRERTLFTPHLGSAVRSARLAIEQAAADAIAAVLAGRHPANAVKSPARSAVS